MKILVIPSWYPPDGGRFFREHAEAVAGQGCRVCVLANRILGLRDCRLRYFFLAARPQMVRKGNLQELRAVYRKLPRSAELNAKRWARKTCRLYGRHFHRRERPDLILAQSALWAGYAASLIRRNFGIPYVVAEHRSRFVFNSDVARKMFRPFHYPLLRQAFLEAAGVVAVSPALMKGIEVVAGKGFGKKVDIIPDQVDTGFFNLPEGRHRDGEFIFFSLGNLVYAKGMDVLLRAFASLPSQLRNMCRLRIGGKGPECKNLQKMAGDLGIGERIVFTGHLDREQVRNEYHRASAFVLPSRFEAFGVVFAEALSTGLPVIASRSGGPGSIVDRSNGYLVPPEDPEALKKAMADMIMKHRGFDNGLIRKKAVEEYSMKAVASRYIELFEKLNHAGN